MLSASLMFLYPEDEARKLLQNVVPPNEPHGVKFHNILILTVLNFQQTAYQALANINTITGILS